MHDVLHSLPGYMKVVLLELLEHPMSREEIQEALNQLGSRMADHHKRDMQQINLEKDITEAIVLKVLEHHNGKYALTPGGREIAEHMQTVIPLFFDTILSVKLVSMITIGVHALLSVLKLAFGTLSKSAGLIADGIDNTADTLSSVLVWLGIRFDKEKLVSIFIVAMMFLSVGGVAIASVHKVLHPEPIREGGIAFWLSLGCGVLMLLISAYQYMVGTRQSNFALLCQSVDSRNHFLTSLLVCGGITLSFLAETVQTSWSSWFHYADALASGIIGLLILRSALELVQELRKTGDQPVQISHFMKSAQEKARKKIVFNWLRQQLRETPLTREQLEERFAQQFCRQTPKILELSGMGYTPERSAEVLEHLDQFVKDKRLLLNEGKYLLSG